MKVTSLPVVSSVLPLYIVTVRKVIKNYLTTVTRYFYFSTLSSLHFNVTWLEKYSYIV